MTGRVIAAVDLGSNSFHMIVARLDNGQLQTVDRLREMVRLAAGLNKEKRLNKDVQQRALECLERFGQRLRELGSNDVRAVGTNTLRAARNSAEFLEAGEQALGHSIDIVSGIEEARLVYLGVAHSLAGGTDSRLVVDIGGGSTELIIGKGLQADLLESLYMGCVNVSMTHFADGRVSGKAMKRAETAARQELEPIEQSYRSRGWSSVCGASGTIRAVERICSQAGWCAEGTISQRAVNTLRDQLVELGHIDQLATLKGLGESRTPVFPGGVAILCAVFTALDIKEMQVSDGALREGLLHDLVGRIGQEDVRGRTVIALAKRCGIDEQQADRIVHTALDLHGQVKADWDLENHDSEKLLRWAGQLHEIGLMVAHDHYHKHGAYIIGQGNLPGFSRQEQQVLAAMVSNHRRQLSPAEFKVLPKRWANRTTRLTLLLRLAVALNRSRITEGLPVMGLKVSKKRLDLQIPADWLTQHPLTSADLESEAAFLEAMGYDLRFTAE